MEALTLGNDLLTSGVLARLLLAFGLVGGGLGLYALSNRALLRRAAGAALPGLEAARPGGPLLVYFTTPNCAPCKTYQRPAIQRLQALLAGRPETALQVIEIDAAARPETAAAWGVLSAPTTFVLDAARRPRHINHGAASAEKLLAQVESVL
jgi:thiol-disulfide isomerase/thioredoxin